MPIQFKAYVVVIVITAIVFALAKPVFTRFMSEADCARRRNAWLVLTTAALLIPNFWVFMAVAAVVIGFCASRDSNPAGLYLFLVLVMPPVTLDIDGLGSIAKLFPINHLRLLSLLVMLPLAFRSNRGSGVQGAAALQPAGQRQQLVQVSDILILLYAALQLTLMFPTESLTASIRRAFLLGIDVLLPYFVLSRCIRSKAALVDAIAAFVLSALVVAPLAVFEFARGWLLYESLEREWGTGRMYSYLMRGDSLRAQVSAGHSIALGYAIAVALGLWLYLQTRIAAAGWRWLGFAALIGGMIASLSRGPWVGAMSVVMLFSVLGPNPWGRSIKLMGALLLGCAVLFATPYAGKVIDYIPFIGTVNEDTVEYRQQLAKLSWQLIQQNPLFGSRYVSYYMEELRQGEGIIDVVNVYAGIALNYGLIGAGLFVGVFAFAAIGCWRASRRVAEIDADLSLLGVSLLATTGGALVTIATASEYLAIPTIFWSLAALLCAYARVSRQEEIESAESVPTHRGATSPAWAGLR